jgi:MFS family permease
MSSTTGSGRAGGAGTAGTAAPGPARDRPGIWAPGMRRLTAGLVLTVTLAAFEALAVATILPVVSRQLGDLRLYGWVFSAFFLATLVGTVIAGGLADRRGLVGPLLGGLTLFGIGLAIGGTAVDMPVLVVGRLVQGLGAGAVPASAYVAIGRAYPRDDRPRMFAILSTAWVVPGLLGPAISALVASAFGWRWVFLGLIPLVVAAAALAAPALRAVPLPDPDARRRLAVLPALAAAVGAGAVLAGLTAAQPVATTVLILVGLAVGLPAVARLTPTGMLTARAGLPVTVLSRGLLTFAFYAGDAYVPLTLTSVRHQSTAFAGLALTAGTMTWTAGAWIQERRVRRWGPRRMVAGGQLLVILALGGLALCLLPAVPPLLVIPAWAVGGLGMGLAYSPISLTALDRAPVGREGWATSAVQLTDVLGTALGAGMAGAAVALGQRHGEVRVGLAVAFALAATVGLVGMAVSPRLPDALREASGVGRG